MKSNTWSVQLIPMLSLCQYASYFCILIWNDGSGRREPRPEKVHPARWVRANARARDVSRRARLLLEMTSGLRKIDNDKSAPHLTSFQIEAKCTIRQPVHFYFSQQLKLPKHHFKLRKNAQLSDLVLNFVSAVSTSKTSFQIATECTIKQPRFKKFFSSSNFPTEIESIPLVCTS